LAPLPASYLEFKRRLLDCFPSLFDTKFMASFSQLETYLPSTSLDEAFATARNSDKFGGPSIEFFSPEFLYETESAHESGFDAFMTGTLFIKMIHYGLSPAPTSMPSDQDLEMKTEEVDSALSSTFATAVVSASEGATLPSASALASAQLRSFSWSPALHVLKQAFNTETASPSPNQQSSPTPLSPSAIQPSILLVFPDLISFSRNRLYLMLSHTHITLDGSDDYVSHFASTFFVGSLGANSKVSISLIKEWFAKVTQFQLDVCFLTTFDAPENAAYVRLMEADAAIEADVPPASDEQPNVSPSPALRPLRPIRFGVANALDFVAHLQALQPPFVISTYLEHCICSCNGAGAMGSSV